MHEDRRKLNSLGLKCYRYISYLPCIKGIWFSDLASNIAWVKLSSSSSSSGSSQSSGRNGLEKIWLHEVANYAKIVLNFAFHFFRNTPRACVRIWIVWRRHFPNVDRKNKNQKFTVWTQQWIMSAMATFRFATQPCDVTSVVIRWQVHR